MNHYNQRQKVIRAIQEFKDSIEMKRMEYLPLIEFKKKKKTCMEEVVCAMRFEGSEFCTRLMGIETY